MDCGTIKKLSRVLKPVTEEQNATAAVALLLTLVDDDTRILFVKRVENPQDPWSGQMALPGGKREAEDKSLKETVMRETAEETGVNLDRFQFLGVLEVIRSAPRPEMKILPFVVLCDYEPLVVLNEKELEAFVWISLEELVRNRGTVTFWFGEFPAYTVGEYVIWGLTYRILEDVIHISECNEQIK